MTTVAFAALVVTSPVCALELQVIELEYRLADEVLPVLRPLLEDGGVLTGMDGRLFVRTSPANLEQIRQAIAAIDRAPRELLITVGQGTVAHSSAAGIQGSIVIGDEADARMQAGARTVQSGLHNVSSVRTLEGSETYIAVGQSGPYRDVSSGFYAIARVAGDEVILEVSSRQQRLGGQRATVQGSGATSTVSAPLGEWIELGAVRDTSAGSTAGLLVWGRRSSESDYSAWVRVDEVR